MNFAKTRTAPTPYPRVLFHGIRIAQALASMVVMSIMYYFIWNLMHENFYAPKTFWVLLAASILTFLSLIATVILYAFFRLSPLWNLLINGVLLGLWAPGFAFLWFYSRKTLGDVCSKATWEDLTGIMVCRLYKALFAFATLGVASTLAAVLLDLIIFRRTVSRGKYKQMSDHEKPSGISPAPYSAPQYSDSRNSVQLDQYTTPETRKADGSGYEVPAEQFNYDTAYQGGHQPESGHH